MKRKTRKLPQSKNRSKRRRFADEEIEEPDEEIGQPLEDIPLRPASRSQRLAGVRLDADQ